MVGKVVIGLAASIALALHHRLKWFTGSRSK